MFLGFDTEFKDHSQSRDPGAASLGSLCAKPNSGEGRFDRIGGTQMRPVLGREVVKAKQPVFVFLKALGCFWIFGLVTGDELSRRLLERLCGWAKDTFHGSVAWLGPGRSWAFYPEC